MSTEVKGGSERGGVDLIRSRRAYKQDRVGKGGWRARSSVSFVCVVKASSSVPRGLSGTLSEGGRTVERRVGTVRDGGVERRKKGGHQQSR